MRALLAILAALSFMWAGGRMQEDHCCDDVEARLFSCALHIVFGVVLTYIAIKWGPR